MFRWVLFTVFFLGATGICSARGIDCAHTLTRVDEMICQSQPLMALDKELNKWYPRAKSSQVNPESFNEAHRIWLSARGECASETCLISVYKGYIASLKEYHMFDKVEDLPGISGNPRQEIDLSLGINHSNIKRISGTNFTVTDDRWSIKPIFTHDIYVNLVNELKKKSDHFSGQLSLSDIVSAVNTKKQFYVYLLFSDYDFLDLQTNWLVVQLSETGEIKVVDISKEDSEYKDCAQDSDTRQTDFTVDGDSLLFINHKNCQPTSKRWSITQQKLTVTSDQQASVGSERHERQANWEGECGDVSCFANNIDGTQSFLAFHNEDVSDQVRKIHKYSALYTDLTTYADSLFWMSGSRNPVEVIRTGKHNLSSWYIDARKQHCFEEACFFVNVYGDYGLWRADFEKKVIRRLLPVKYIKAFFPYSINSEEYIIFCSDLIDGVYIAKK